jgi:cytochrome c-type biogenesis protein
VSALVGDGSLLLGAPVALAAGALSFASPCVLPLVPGYLGYVGGMDGSGTARRPGGRLALAAALFVLGFSVVFVAYGAVLGGLGHLVTGHARLVTQVIGGLTILLGLLFAGVFDRFSFAGRILRPSARPKAGLAGAPLLGMMFGLGWTPCTGTTLTAVMGLSVSTGTAARGGVLAFVYALGLGIPFLLMSVGFQWMVRAFAFARRHARLITRIGGAMLVCVGLLEVTGTWSTFVAWLQVHWVGDYQSPI